MRKMQAKTMNRQVR